MAVGKRFPNEYSSTSPYNVSFLGKGVRERLNYSN